MALSLSLLWHMHQPDYRDPSGVMGMPWVFLHAIKDYYEMPWHVSRFQRIRATFNLTPPLLEQLMLYEKEGASRDRFLRLWAKDPRTLSGPERDFVWKICHSAQFETMVAPLPRFAELFHRDTLDEGEWVEMEVLFLLAWCGNYLRQNDPVVGELIRKGRGFTPQEKGTLLQALLAFVPRVLDLYRDLAKEGRIALATTPYNHPILPLLLDMNNAKIANPATPIPANHFPLPDDAKEQVARAVALYRRVFGEDPQGFWPAEGAVDTKSVALYKEQGLRWIATDEAILFKSLGSEDRSALYTLHAYEGVLIAFRDHGLSDLIGFTYRSWEGERAAEDFMGRLAKIHREHPDGTVSVILDGENAWEFYPENGWPFFEALYRKLEETPWCETVTMAELADREAAPLPALAPGSWIYGNFDTWVGHPEKNAAWELIFQTKRDYLHHAETLKEAQKAAVTDHFLAAECSDWFWWYGEDHYTEYAGEFDTLFRSHLIAVYETMGVAPPANLFKPIAGDRKDLHALINAPQAPIHPIIDGRVTSFFEWLGSGLIDETRGFGTMQKTAGPVTALRWGQDERSLYFRLDGRMEKLRQCRLRIYGMHASVETMIEVDLAAPPSAGEVRAAAERIVEVAVVKATHFPGVRSLRLRLEILEGDEVVQMLPGLSELTVDLQDDYATHWFV